MRQARGGECISNPDHVPPKLGNVCILNSKWCATERIQIKRALHVEAETICTFALISNYLHFKNICNIHPTC